MGLIGNLLLKSVSTAARNSTINAVGNVATGIIAASANKESQKDDVVIKNGKVFVKPPRSSEEYRGKKALDVVQELLGAGFEQITLQPEKKLSERSVKKYGQIKNISINGNSDFLGVKRVLASSHIVIQYLDFKNNVNKAVYTNIERIKPGTVSSVDELEVQSQENSRANNPPQYCSFCGEKILNKKAKFCSACGQKIE